MTTEDMTLKACPFVPAFSVGDIVEIGGEYAEDFRGTFHHIAEVSWNNRKDRIEYGTYQIDTKDGMTDGWLEEHLILVKKHITRSEAPQVADEELREAIDDIKAIMEIEAKPLIHEDGTVSEEYVVVHTDISKRTIETLIRAATQPKPQPDHIVEPNKMVPTPDRQASLDAFDYWLNGSASDDEQGLANEVAKHADTIKSALTAPVPREVVDKIKYAEQQLEYLSEEFPYKKGTVGRNYLDNACNGIKKALALLGGKGRDVT